MKSNAVLVASGSFEREMISFRERDGVALPPRTDTALWALPESHWGRVRLVHCLLHRHPPFSTGSLDVQHLPCII